MALGVGAVAILALSATPAAAGSDDGGAGGLNSQANGNHINLDLYLGGEPVEDPSSAKGGITTVRYERQPAELCHGGDFGDLQGCAWLIEKVANADCPKGALPVDPLFSQERKVTGGKAGPWPKTWDYVADAALCLNPATLKAEATKAFRSLTVEPSPIHVQPGTGEVLINMFTITYTDATAETFDISLGEGDQKIPVQVEAVPASFTWSYGSEEGDEGFPQVTTDPGKPYPDQTVTHTYTHKGPATLDLTTTWTGRFRIQGIPGGLTDPDTWTAIDGQATTTSPTVHLNVYEKRPHLVEDTLG
jgi:hypothetical protein